MAGEHPPKSGPIIISSHDRDDAGVSGLEASYRVVRLLGRGTMSSVYLAEQVSMARPVALKILSPALASDKAFVDRFLREARAAARLNHPNIVSAIDFGECDSRFFLAMEFIDGESLAAMLGRDGAIEESRVVGIGLQVMAALRHAYQHNVIHLDVKPANIMICKDGMVKLTDFGLAMILDSPGAAEASQKAVGTPYYMSPEQVEGGALDWRSDQFSLGASLYEAVTGEKPFQGKSVSDILVKRFFEKPEPAWKVGRKKASRAFSAVLAKMLSRSPESRYQSFADLERDFGLVRDGKKPAVARMQTSGSLRAPTASSWETLGYGSVRSRVEDMLWRKRWNLFIYSSCLFLALLGGYAFLHRREIVGPAPPRLIRQDYLAEAEKIRDDKPPPLRENWLGAMRLAMRVEKDRDPELLKQTIMSFRGIAANREYREAAYAVAAARRADYLEEILKEGEAGGDPSGQRFWGP